MRLFLLLVFVFSFSVFADPTQPMRKLGPQPLPNFSSCTVSSAVCMDFDEFQHSEEVLFSNYCLWSDEFGQKIAATQSCTGATPKQFKCFSCTCPAGYLRDPQTHVCVPDQHCIFGIRDYSTGACYPDWCPYGDCPHNLEQCREGENTVLVSTPDPMQDACVCRDGDHWDPNLQSCVSCPSGYKWIDTFQRCEQSTCDIKEDLSLPPEEANANAFLECDSRRGEGFSYSYIISPVYIHGYCWSAYEIGTHFCDANLLNCDLSPLTSDPSLSDNQRLKECKEPTVRRSSAPASSVANSSRASSVSNSSHFSSQSGFSSANNSSFNSVAFSSTASNSFSSDFVVFSSASNGDNGNGNGNGNGPCDSSSADYLSCLGHDSLLPSHTLADSGATSFSEVNTAFYNRISHSPLVGSFSRVKNLVRVESATCPILAVDLSETIIGRAISTSVHCDLMVDISPFIKIIMMIIWSFIAFRIFASA